MDKKNTIIGVLLIMAAFYFMYDSTTKDAAAMRAQRQTAAAVQSAQPSGNPKSVVEQRFAEAAKSSDQNVKEELCTLRNENLAVNFTNKGGAIADVEILKYADSQETSDPFVFNKVKGAIPAMCLAFFDPSSALPSP